MPDGLRRFGAGVRTRRFHVLAGVGVTAAMVVPAQALGRHSTHAASHAAGSTPSCGYSWYDPKADAPSLSGQQANQLDIIEGAFGLNKADNGLRVVLTIKNLSKSIPAPGNYNDYQVRWTNPSGDKGPNAVDISVGSSGTVTFTDGTVTVVNGNTNYAKSSTTKATGKFGSGPNGKIEVDVPLSELHLKTGQTLGNPIGDAASGANPPGLAGIADTDQGKLYKLDTRSCVDTTG